MTANTLTLHTIDNTPLVLDTDLAERLGVAVPRIIRPNLIKANEAGLRTLGDFE